MTAELIDLADRRRLRRSSAPRPPESRGRAAARAPEPTPPGDEPSRVILTEAELRAAVESLRQTVRLEPPLAARR